jgi:hypothetical protein
MHQQAGSGFYIQRRRAVRSPADDLILFIILMVVINSAHLKKPAAGRAVMAYRLLFNFRSRKPAILGSPAIFLIYQGG